jgi:hypothetical protein
MDAKDSISTKTPTERITEMSDEVKFSDKVLQNMHGNVLLARFKQLDQEAEINVHEVLKESFYFSQAINKIIDLCNSSMCNLYDVKIGDSEDILSVRPKKIITSTGLFQSGNFKNIKEINLRFATFFIEINPPEHGASAYKVGLINTTPRRFYYTIDITNSPEEITYFTQNKLLSAVSLKIYKELKVLGYKLDGTDIETRERPLKLMANFDIYYDRHRSVGGLFHRDTNLGLGNEVINFSLEYFTDNEYIFLGPEILPVTIEEEVSHPQINVKREGLSSYTQKTPHHVDDIIKWRAEVPHADFDSVAHQYPFPPDKSLRLLAKDGTTMMCNEEALIHATPALKSNRYEDPTIEYKRANIATFLSDTQRLDVQNPHHPVVQSTEWEQRSFVRTHYARVPLDYQPIIFIPLTAWNFEIHDSATPVTEGDLFGGGDVVISKVNLIEFKIVTESSKLPFKLNFDIPFEQVIGESNIKKHQLQELELITSFTSKKGGKNRRYKRKYNNKTKKNKKTIKVRKQKTTKNTKKTKKK